MKKNRILSMISAAALLLGGATSCSDSIVDDGGSSKNQNFLDQEGMFFAINIDLPSAKNTTRSETGDPDDNGYSTSSDGVEIGQDYENYVGEVVIVLSRYSADATKNNSFIAAATVPKKDLKPIGTTGSSYQITSKFSKTQLDAFYRTNPEDCQCNIYVFTNPTSGIKAIIFGIDDDDEVNGAQLGSNAWINQIRTLNNTPTSNIADKTGNEGKGAFLMSNALVAIREIPSSLDDWRFYTTDGNPFNLSGDNADVYIDNGQTGRGSVKLERVAARFDFRDGSPLGNFSYHVVLNGTSDTPEEERYPIIDIQLINMSLVNVNKKYYPIRRVSNNGAPDNAVICGPEIPWTVNANGGYTGGNYIVDAAYTIKKDIASLFAGGATPTNIPYSENFFYPFLSNSDQIDNSQRTHWFTNTCPEVIEGTLNNTDSWNTDKTRKNYHIWTYATENIIADVEDQINGITTGVVFKGKMVATEEALNSEDEDVKLLAQAINNVNGILNDANTAPVIYQYAGNLYLGWKKIRNAALSAAISNIEWVPNDASDPYGEGHWTYTAVNESNSLYAAVYGNGGFGTVEFTYTLTDKDGNPLTDEEGNVIKKTGSITDPVAEDQTSPNYLYNKWEADKSNANLAAYKKATTDANISIYESYRDNANYGGTGFFVYYYYWNRHNDNGNNGVMGPMEFAVVRNNVYKLAVTDIKKLGHPRLTENDPERPTGGTPDEKEDVYITVTAEILPWVVRVNDIVF